MKTCPVSADSSACWDQSRPADQPTSRPTDLQTLSHLSTIHTRPSNPDETTSSLLLWGKPYAIFLRGREGGRRRGWAAVQPTGPPTNKAIHPRSILDPTSIQPRSILDPYSIQPRPIIDPSSIHTRSILDPSSIHTSSLGPKITKFRPKTYF